MTREELFQEYATVFFALAPSAREADDLVSREDVESLRLKLVAISDRVATYMAMDAAFAAEDEADMRQQIEADEREGVGRD